MELVVRTQGRQGPHADTVGKENLGGAVDPGGSLQQLLPLGSDVVLEASHGALQCEGPAEKDGHHEVREEGGEPDDLPRAVETLGDDPVDTEPGQHQTPSQLPLNAAQAELQAVVDLEDAVLPELLHGGRGLPNQLRHVVLGHVVPGVVLQQDVVRRHVVGSSEAGLLIPPTI